VSDFFGWLGSIVETEVYRGIILTSGVVVAIASVWSARNTARKKQTADAIFASRTDTNLVEGLRCVSQLHESDNSNLRFFGKADKLESDEVKKMTYVLNYYENVSVGIGAGIYDEAMWRKAQYSTVTRLWDKARPFIEEIRETRRQSTMYQEFEQLATRWKANPLPNSGSS
jgi:hypothetical protein